jgi:disulfide bond formation protein DsbB
MRTSPLVMANRVALGLPLVLAGGALASQYLGGLHPCEMCHWQRWPHYAAIVAAAFAWPAPVPARRALVTLAAVLIAASGAIGVFHAGVEYGWWQGITACTSMIRPTGDTRTMLDQIMSAPVIRCDVAQWRLLGVSLAGFNAILSIGGAAAILRLAAQRSGR